MIDPVIETDVLTDQTLAATPDTCFWGYLDATQPAVFDVDSGASSRRGGHPSRRRRPRSADGRRPRAIWAAIPEAERAPGVHIMTGPIDVRAPAR